MNASRMTSREWQPVKARVCHCDCTAAADRFKRQRASPCGCSLQAQERRTFEFRAGCYKEHRWQHIDFEVDEARRATFEKVGEVRGLWPKRHSEVQLA